MSDKETNDGKEKFLCGVVEGFYGRCWTTDKRKDLFIKMQSWGMNSYLYAPKDDCKHRAYWREPYTVEETDHLQSLISLASSCNIDFYYALSPGLDIIYSSKKEIACLKRKFDQVAQLGCKSFALLFDDIEPEMCKQDKEIFQSFAHAHIAVTNDIFHHLNEPNFLFCPTQYCTARAMPTIANSEYLNTIGSKLSAGINVMWTGDKVISKSITIKMLEEINSILRRKIVIWDNEHANDYDQKRVFLGPYSGRSPEIIKEINGVMTNPNCEYGANFVPIHTLAQWSKCSADGTCSASAISESVSADIKLEIEASNQNIPLDIPPHVYHPKKALINAINEWISEFAKQKTVWGPMIKPQVGLTATTFIPTVNTCSSPPLKKEILEGSDPVEFIKSSINLSGITENESVSSQTKPVENETQVNNDNVEATSSASIISSTLQPISMPMMNSLVAPNKVVMDQSLLESNPQTPSIDYPMKNPDLSPPELPSTMPPPVIPIIPIPEDIVPGPTYVEPMDVIPSEMGPPKESKINDTPMESVTNPSTPLSAMHDDETDLKLPEDDSEGGIKSSDVVCNSMSSSTSSLLPVHGKNITNNPEVTTMLCEEVCTDIKEVDNPDMTLKDLLLLCQLFYLPSEHGHIGLELLDDFYWLKRNAVKMLPPGCPSENVQSEDRLEWEQRAAKLKKTVLDIQTLFVKLCACRNRELVYDLYTYLWDMCVVVQTLEAFVQWMSKGVCSPKIQNYVLGQQTWFSGLREAFLSGDHEPWMFRGGLVSDLLRLLPLDSGSDLYQYTFPEAPAPLLYYVRPYQSKDEGAVYKLAAEYYERSIDAPMGLCPADRELIGDRIVGPFLTLNPEHTFVCENSLDGTIVGYACSAPDVRNFYSRLDIAWTPEMKMKYPIDKKSISNNTTDEEMLTPIEKMAQSFHEINSDNCVDMIINESDQSTEQSQTSWGILHMYIGEVKDSSLSKRLTMIVLACLRASGTLKVLVELKNSPDISKEREFYTKLGFIPVVNEVKEDNPCYFSRSF